LISHKKQTATQPGGGFLCTVLDRDVCMRDTHKKFALARLPGLWFNVRYIA
jgi:hypothetical protein